MCSARLFAVRIILLQRFKVLPARLPDFGSLPTLTQGSCKGRQGTATGTLVWRQSTLHAKRTCASYDEVSAKSNMDRILADDWIVCPAQARRTSSAPIMRKFRECRKHDTAGPVCSVTSMFGGTMIEAVP